MLVPYLTESSLHNYFEHLEHAIIFYHFCVVLRCLSPVHSLFVYVLARTAVIVVIMTLYLYIPLFWMLWMFWVWYMRALLMVFLPLWHVDWWCSLSLSSKIPRAHRLKVPCAPLNTCGASLVLSLALHPVEIPNCGLYISLRLVRVWTAVQHYSYNSSSVKISLVPGTLLCAWY